MKLIEIARSSTSPFAVRFLPSGVITLLLLLLIRSSVFADSLWIFDATSSHGNTASKGPSSDPIFVDVSAAAGLNTGPGFPFGDPIWGDFDNDGDIDLFVDNHFYAAPYLYQNKGDGTFANIFLSSGIASMGDKHGSAWVDYDNDGDLDLSITKGAKGGQALGIKRDELYDNLAVGQFRNSARRAGVTNTWGRGRGVAWGDYDNDGYLDLMLGNLKTDLVLLRNNGDRTFTDKAATAGLAGLQYIECVFADYNNDGFPDIFCTLAEAQSTSIDLLFKNNGNGTFKNVTAQAGILPLNYGRSLAWGDYDNDGDLDLFISRGRDDDSLKQTLYRNNGNGT